MCKDCGCGQGPHIHSHDHEDHPHSAPRYPRIPGVFLPTGGRVLEVRQRVLAHNDDCAARNRAEFDHRGIFAVNIISSPGSGKTTLLERTLDALKGEIQCAVITGDQRTERDAERLRGRGAPVVQIETGNSCHLQAEQIESSLPQVLGCAPRILLIENIGNLICPAAFELGEHEKVALLSVTEGEDKPIKYPVLFSGASLVVITKVDLIPHLDWNRSENEHFIRQVNPSVPIVEVSARSGDGMGAWLAYLRNRAAAFALGTSVGA